MYIIKVDRACICGEEEEEEREEKSVCVEKYIYTLVLYTL